MLRRNVKLIHYLNSKYPGKAVSVTYRIQRQRSDKKSDEWKKECPPDSSGRGFYYTVGGLIIGTGAFVLYAKYDDDFRKWLKENAPIADEFVAIVAAEQKSYGESLLEFLEYAKKSILSTFGDVSMPGAEKEGAGCAPGGDKSAPPPAAAPPAPKPDEKTEQPKKPAEPAKGKSKKDALASLAGSFDITGVFTIMTEILSRALTMKHTLESAYKEIICIYKDLAQFYQQVVDGSVQNADPSVMNKIKELRSSKSEALKLAEDTYKEALNMLEDLKDELTAQDKIVRKSSLISDEQKEEIMKVRNDIAAVLKELDETRKNFERERARLTLTEKYWKQVQEARKHFSEELEILFPSVRIQDKNMKLADEELDLFILYAFQNILFYQKELAKIDSLYKANLDKAFAGTGDKDVIRAVIESEMEQERRKIGAEFQKRMLVVRAECERDLRQGMMRQAEAHVAHIKELVELKERQAEIQLQRTMDEKMGDLRQEHQTQLADIIGRMRALDAIVNKKLAADEKSSKAQELWASCQALQEALQAADPSEGIYKQFRPLESLVEAVYASSAQGDEYVDVVLSSLPVEARRRGVFTSLMLKDRFLVVKRVAKKVALLPEGGAPLPVMFLSWLQSKLILDNDDIPAEELTNKEFDPTKLNTFQILARANYWMERNDYKQALKYMNLLEGAPRAVSGDWIREMQIYLEVAQAAKALMAYAASSSSAYT